MRRALVTGAAGFIGSHLSERLLGEGWAVRAIDNFDPYYDRALKEKNLQALRGAAGFEFIEDDLEHADLDSLLEGVDWVFHQAARAGVRRSWGEDFATYVRPNILCTQRLLEAVRRRPVERLVYASSSSVYGEARGGAVTEETPRRPLSPYGVTKLAGEDLVSAYVRVFDLPAVSLRYFTVFGPRQRPDMAFHRFYRAILTGQALPLYGDGGQERDFTFVADAVTANLLAAERGRPGGIYNIGGGSPAKIAGVIELMEQISGSRARIERHPPQAGDPRRTAADTTRARTELGFAPATSLRAGLEAMHEWIETLVEPGVPGEES